jgi:VanZ family protein
MRKLFKLKYTILWAIVIFILCAIPGNDLPKSKLFSIPNFDKLVHFGMYFCLELIVLIEYGRYRIIRSEVIAVSIILCILFGGTIELLQGWIFIDRSASFWDMVANLTGTTTAILTHRLFMKKNYSAI